jgi:hypothetical protein
VVAYLVSGTSVATVDVGVHKLSETREVIVSGQEFISLGLTWMTSCGRVVYLVDKLNFDLVVVWDID